jgi:hypothetical protein
VAEPFEESTDTDKVAAFSTTHAMDALAAKNAPTDKCNIDDRRWNTEDRPNPIDNTVATAIYNTTKPVCDKEITSMLEMPRRHKPYPIAHRKLETTTRMSDAEEEPPPPRISNCSSAQHTNTSMLGSNPRIKIRGRAHNKA